MAGGSITLRCNAGAVKTGIILRRSFCISFSKEIQPMLSDQAQPEILSPDSAKSFFSEEKKKQN